MKLRILFILSLLVNASIVNGKITDGFVFSGIVVNSDNIEEKLQQVHIILKKGLGTITDNNGHFYLYVNINDTLVFSHIGFTENIIVVKERTLKNKTIFLLPDTFMIKEVKVHPLQNYKEFKELFINMPIEHNEELFNAKRNIEQCLFQANSGFSLGVTAEDYTDRSLKVFKNSIIYPGQIPPENMINLITLFSKKINHYTQFLKTNKKLLNQYNYLNKNIFNKLQVSFKNDACKTFNGTNKGCSK